MAKKFGGADRMNMSAVKDFVGEQGRTLVSGIKASLGSFGTLTFYVSPEAHDTLTKVGVIVSDRIGVALVRPSKVYLVPPGHGRGEYRCLPYGPGIHNTLGKSFSVGLSTLERSHMRLGVPFGMVEVKVWLDGVNAQVEFPEHTARTSPRITKRRQMNKPKPKPEVTGSAPPVDALQVSNFDRLPELPVPKVWSKGRLRVLVEMPDGSVFAATGFTDAQIMLMVSKWHADPNINVEVEGGN